MIEKHVTAFPRDVLDMALLWTDFPLMRFQGMYALLLCDRFDLLRKAAALFGDSPWLLTSEEDGGEAFSKITYKQVR